MSGSSTHSGPLPGPHRTDLRGTSAIKCDLPKVVDSSESDANELV